MKKRLVGIVVVLALVFAVMSLSVSAPPGPLGVPPAGGNGGGLPSPTGSYGGLYTPTGPVLTGTSVPAGCTVVSTPVCGNGIAEAGEQCDLGSSTDAGTKFCPDGTSVKIFCYGCNFVENPCGGCYTDTDCIDGNICTIDTCVSNKCTSAPAPYDTVKAYDSTTGAPLETCGGTVTKKGKCGNGEIDPGETCASCSADVKCATGQVCTASGTCQTKACTAGSIKNHQCATSSAAKTP